MSFNFGDCSSILTIRGSRCGNFSLYWQNSKAQNPMQGTGGNFLSTVTTFKRLEILYRKKLKPMSHWFSSSSLWETRCKRFCMPSQGTQLFKNTGFYRFWWKFIIMFLDRSEKHTEIGCSESFPTLNTFLALTFTLLHIVVGVLTKHSIPMTLI